MYSVILRARRRIYGKRYPLQKIKNRYGSQLRKGIELQNYNLEPIVAREKKSQFDAKLNEDSTGSS